MADFLTGLGDILGQQFGFGENKLNSLDIVDNGHVQRYGRLGDFAKQIDQSAERTYTEEGSFRNQFYSRAPKQRDIITQDPDLTVLVKKRFASSLAENFRSDLMDETERLFFRASKVLFQNKCKQIAALEKLSKIEKISNEIGRVDYHLLPILFGATDALTNISSDLSGSLGGLTNPLSTVLGPFKSIVDRVREIVALSSDAENTTWITNVPDSFKSNFGEGTGVIEFTNVKSVNTTTTLKFAEGRFDLQFSDPYSAMLITNLDIEQAISDATNKFYNNAVVQFSSQSLSDTVSFQKQQLNDIRRFRGANPIIFIMSPDTFLGKRVRALIDNRGFELIFDYNATNAIDGGGSIDPSALINSDALGKDGLTPDEVGRFKDIIISLFTQVSLNLTTRRKARFDNQDPKKNLNSVRKKMRLHYGNKLVIQPMDNVHIYISSKKKLDTKIIGGLQNNFSAFGFMQGLNNLTQKITDTLNVFNGTSLEKEIFVGSDFPNWLWLSMRSTIVGDKNGVHVFAGIVETASSSFNNGAFEATASGKDNAGYFEHGVVNFKPSVDVFNGTLYDPLTPFNISFDSLTGVNKDTTPALLDENIALFNSEFVKDKNGLFAGTAPSQRGYLLQDADRVKNNNPRRVFYDPDGMVYRWKEGIGTLELFGDAYDPNQKTSQAPAITTNPFAGQDIMNILSLLITGEPYNFATYYKSAIQFDSFKRNSSTNEPPATSYFRGLQSQLKQKNSIYGNFIPFKQLSTDDATFAKIIGNQLNASAYDQDLQDLIAKRASLADKVKILQTSSQPFSDNSLKSLDIEIQAKINLIYKELNSANTPVNIVGNDISFDYDPFSSLSGSKTRLDDKTRKELRRKINLLTKRLVWKVRANEDPNLLIVDDSYDKDLDIQAFEKAFSNPSLFQSEYTTVADKIRTVKNVIMGLEIFANTQGHIEIRNPKYNKIPSSVFYKMLRLKDDLGIQVFPQFIEDLSTNQLNQLYEQIEVLEDEIRLYCLALNKNTDSDCSSLINSFDQDLAANVNKLTGNFGSFIFLSDPDTGKIDNSIASLKLQSQPDQLFDSAQQKLDVINSQLDLSVLSVVSRAQFIQSVVPTDAISNSNIKFTSNTENAATMQSYSRQSAISSRLQDKTGQSFDLSQLFSNTNNSILVNTSFISSLDVLQITNELASRIQLRQSAIKLAANALKNIQESATLFKGVGGSSNDAFSNKLLIPSLNQSNSIPKIFEGMIEDEAYDDLGVGSGSRYIIKNRDVISYSIAENRPPYTSIEVVGKFGDLFIRNQDLPQDLDVFQNGGNALTTTAAVDYDMWRMYGMTVPQSIEAPYLTNPSTQCAPYAVSLLNAARKEILSGTLQIVGNEYQQPGEVIYIEPRDQLFYIDSVNHSFTFGQGFRTSLNISYGHNPGEYIPTWLDVVGKILYKNKDITKYAHRRQGNIFNQEHIGIIVGNYSNTDIFSSSSDITSGPYGEANRNTLQKIIDYAAPILSLNSDGINPVLEIRTYYNSSSSDFSSINSYTASLSDAVISYLTSGNDLSSNSLPSATLKQSGVKLSSFKDNGQVKTLSVDANKITPGEFRSPSALAFGAARDISSKTSSTLSNKTDQKSIDAAIYNYVVDCWIVFKNPQANK